MEGIAPTALAQDWDNVGLLAGGPAAPVRRVLLCIDLAPAVVAEAVKKRANLVLAYHPPIFKPIKSLRADSRGTDAVVFECIRRGIAIYSTHTALDAADGGTNDVLASLCGIEQTEPLEYVDDPSGISDGPKFKLAVFVPAGEVERVAEAMFEAGAGRIGDYTKCAFRTAGHGSFFGSESTKPTLGRKGRLEFVDEVRLETIVPGRVLPDVIRAMLRTHSYEEPAFDIYPLKTPPARGIGRVGNLPRPVTLGSLAGKLKRATGAACVQLVGPRGRKVERAAIVAGSAGDLPFRVKLSAADVIVTGEIRHHDALTIQRSGAAAIALGHWASEKPVLRVLAQRLVALLPSVRVGESRVDADPLAAV